MEEYNFLVTIPEHDRWLVFPKKWVRFISLYLTAVELGDRVVQIILNE